MPDVSRYKLERYLESSRAKARAKHSCGGRRAEHAAEKCSTNAGGRSSSRQLGNALITIIIPYFYSGGPAPASWQRHRATARW